MNAEPYDFAKSRLPAEWQQQLATWSRNALVAAARLWAREVPIPLQAALRPVESGRYAEIVPQVPAAVVAHRVAVGQGGSTLLYAARPLARAILAGLMGDDGAAGDASRELTPVEEALWEYFLGTLWLPPLETAWPGKPFACRIERREEDLRCCRLFGAGEALVWLRWAIKVPSGEHEVGWLIPKAILDIHLDASASAAAVEESPAVVAERIEQTVKALALSVQVVLGTAELKLSQLSALREGDVLLLGQRISDPLVATLAGRPKLLGWPAKTGTRRVFQVESTIDE